MTDTPQDNEAALREQVQRIVAALAYCGDNFMKPEAVSLEVRKTYEDSILRLITERETAARVDELERIKHGNSYSGDETRDLIEIVNHIGYRIAQLKKEDME